MFVTGKHQIFVSVSDFFLYNYITFYYKIQIMLGPVNFESCYHYDNTRAVITMSLQPTG